MANIGSKQVGGEFPVPKEWRHYMPRLFKPFAASKGRRALILDPFYNTGDQVLRMAYELNLEPYGVELQDKNMAEGRENMAKFYTSRGMPDYSLTRLINDDSFSVEMSHGAFSIVYLNSPFDNLMVGADHIVSDTTNRFATQRFELTSLKQFVKYLAPNGYLIWVAYAQHMTRKVFNEFHKNFDQIRVFRFPEEHLDRYTMVCVVAQYVKGHEKSTEDSVEVLEKAAKFVGLGQNPEKIPDFEMAYNKLEETGLYVYKNIPALSMQRGSVYFSPKKQDLAAALELNKRYGAQTINKFFQLTLPTQPTPIEQPLHQPNKRQMVVNIASGMLNNILLERESKKALLRGSVREAYALIGKESETITNDKESFTRVTETTMIRPDHHIMLLYGDGKVEDLSGAEKLKELIESNSELLISTFNAKYKPFFDMKIHRVWEKLLLAIHPGGNPKYKFFKSQRYVTVCTIEHLAIRSKQITNGQMGVGKTPLTGATIMGLRLLHLAVKHALDTSRHPELPVFAKQFGITGDELDNLVRTMCERYGVRPEEITGIPIDGPVLVAVPPIAPRVWMNQEIDPIYSGFRTQQIFNPGDVNEFMAKAMANTDETQIFLGVISYENAKSNEGREPFAAIRYTRRKRLESDEHDNPVMRVEQKKRAIDPITGEFIFDTQGKEVPYEHFTKEKRRKVPVPFYTGKVFWGYDSEVVTLPNGNKEIRQTGRKRESIVLVRPLGREEIAANKNAGWPRFISRQYSLFSEVRTFGMPKVGNGRADTPMKEVTLKGGPMMQLKFHDKDGYPIKQPVWEEVINKEKRMLVPDFDSQKNLIPSEPILDPWLASKGIRCLEDTGKTNALDKVMRQAKRQHYRVGEGISKLDELLKAKGLQQYQIGVGQIKIRNPRFPVAEYVRRFYYEKVALFIADELHSFKSNTTEVGAAFRNLAMSSVKVLGLTGTLYGGKSSSVYALAYAFDPSIRKRFPWTRGAPMTWVEAMGVRKMVEIHDVGGGNAALRSGRKAAPRITEAPGASPDLMRLLAKYCLWFSLADMSSHMPKKEEFTYAIEFDEDQQALYDEVYEELRDYNSKCIVAGDKSFLAPYYQNMLCLPDAMHRDWNVLHKIRLDKGAARAKHAEILPSTVLYIPSLGMGIKAKEREAMKWLEQDIDDGRRVIIAMNQTESRDIRSRWYDLIAEFVPKAKAFILKSSTPEVSKRSGYIRKMADEGFNVMITNGGLITVAISINNFSVWYSIEYNASLYTFSQSTARINRPNQEREGIIYRHFYYHDKFQTQAIENIADKVQAAAVLMGAEGGELSAMMGSDERVENYEGILDAMENGHKLATNEEIQNAFNSAVYNETRWSDSAWFVEGDQYEEAGEEFYAEPELEAILEDDQNDSAEEELVAEEEF